MPDEVICKINMFDNTQTLYYQGQSCTSTIQELYNAATAFCYSFNVYKIHFFGNEDFINGLAADIFADEMTRYNQNKIEIEVN